MQLAAEAPRIGDPPAEVDVDDLLPFVPRASKPRAAREARAPLSRRASGAWPGPRPHCCVAAPRRRTSCASASFPAICTSTASAVPRAGLSPMLDPQALRVDGDLRSARDPRRLRARDRRQMPRTRSCCPSTLRGGARSDRDNSSSMSSSTRTSAWIRLRTSSLLRASPRCRCVSFGHPDTTGIPNMDWWISSERFEPPGAEEHYSERLWRMPGGRHARLLLPPGARIHAARPRAAWIAGRRTPLYLPAVALQAASRTSTRSPPASCAATPQGRLVLIGSRHTSLARSLDGDAWARPCRTYSTASSCCRR